MGNQASGGLPPTSADAPTHRHGQGEPLESFMKEKQRDEHLKNLSFKRSKSLRKSISKRLKRKRAPEHDVPDANEPQPKPLDGGGDPLPGTRTSGAGAKKEERTASVERLDRRDFAAEEKKRSRNLVGEVEPLPTHVLRVRLVFSRCVISQMDFESLFIRDSSLHVTQLSLSFFFCLSMRCFFFLEGNPFERKGN